MSQGVELVTAMVASLDCDIEQFGLQFQVVRGHIPRDESSSLSENPRVIFSPGGRIVTRHNRGESEVEQTVYAAIVAKVKGGTRTEDKDDLSAFESLLNFVDEIEQWLSPVGEGDTAVSWGDWDVASVEVGDYSHDQALAGKLMVVITIKLTRVI